MKRIDFRNNGLIRANAVPIAVVISAIAVVVSVISLSASIYQNRYNRYGVEASTELTCDYQKKGQTTASGSFKPSKGQLEFGYTQTKGNSKCRYTFYYKKNTASTYKVVRKNYKAAQNNKYYGSYKIVKANGRTTYNFKNVKEAGANKASLLILDVALI